MEEMSPQAPPSGDSRRKRRRQSTLSAESQRELGHMRTRRGTGSTSFVGSGSGIHFAQTVRHAFAQNSLKQRSVEAVDEELVPGEDDRLHYQNPPSSLWHGDELALEPEGSEVANAISFDDLVRWSRPYFDSWHPPFPFLHAPTVLGVMENVSMRGLSSLSHTDVVVVRSIMSISLADRRQLPKESVRPVLAHLVFRTIDDALCALQPSILQPSSLAGLQAVLAIQLFLISMLRLNAASRLGGLIVRMAFHLGLHRCPSRFSQFSAADNEIRRRVFWSIYCLERYLSQSLGLPLDLKDDDLDVCTPGSEHHSLPTNGSASNFTESNYVPHHLLLSTFLAKHGRIKGLILELRNKSVLHSSTDPDEVAHIDAEISRWWNEAQDLLDSSFENDPMLNVHGHSAPMPSPPNDTRSTLKSSHKLLLIVQRDESVILLNRPVITSGYNTSAFAAAMQKCIGASKSIISNVYRHLGTEMKCDGSHEGRIYSPLFWPGFVWMVWQSGLILLYAAAEGHYSVHVAQREADCCISILENLSLRGSFWPGACAAAIRELQSALKSKFINDNNDGVRQPTSASTPLSPHTAKATSTATINARESLWSNPSAMYSDTMRPIDTSSVRLNQSNHASTPSTVAIGVYDGPNSTTQDQNPLSVQDPDTNMASSRMQQCTYRLQGTLGAIASNSQIDAPLDISSGPLSDIIGVGSFDYWPGSNVAFESRNTQLNDFENIFQLMDVSYLLSEQMAEAQTDLMGHFYHPTTNDRAHPEFEPGNLGSN